MLRSVVDGIGAGYDYIVMDNEACMEHLSRRTTRDVDHLLLVTDASQRGLAAAEAMVVLSKELDINVKQRYLDCQPRSGQLSDSFRARIDAMGVPLLAMVPLRRSLVVLRRAKGPPAGRLARRRACQPCRRRKSRRRC